MPKQTMAEREAAKPEHSTEITPEQRTKILDLIRGDRNKGTVAVLREAGVIGSRGELRDLVDEEFAEEMREARGLGKNNIRREMVRRAIEGVEEDVYSPSGKKVGTRVVYSDRLLAKLADAYLPEFRKTGTGGEGGGNTTIVIDQRGVPLAEVRAVLEAAGAFRSLEHPVIDGDGPATPRPALPPAGEVLAEPTDL